MESVIHWTTESPTINGEYLTVRQHRKIGNKHISINYRNNGKWAISASDSCDIIAWCLIKDIKI